MTAWMSARYLGTIAAWFWAIAVTGLAWGAAGPASPRAVEAPQSREARQVFERAQDKVLQIRVVLKATQSQTATGSGFLASEAGHVVTNYHVVSEVALEPDRHQLEYVRADGSRGALELVAIDVLHDLAVVRIPGHRSTAFGWHAGGMRKGDRGYSLGNPLGIGLSIVEGTYNGTVEESFTELIHFTGAINPGMSGGPAVTAAGEVFGVNVAIHRRGQLVGYLVPAGFAQKLLRAAPPDGGRAGQDFRRDIVRQLLQHQEALLGALLSAALPVQSLAHFVVPNRPAPFVRCWGAGERRARQQYEEDSIVCESQAGVYVGRDIRVEPVRFEHTLLKPKGMGAWRFARLLGQEYAAGRSGCNCVREEFTEFVCSDEYVDTGGLALRAAVCGRAYKKFPGLYDLQLRFVSVHSSEEGLVGKLTLTGVGYERGMAFVRHYLESLRWTP